MGWGGKGGKRESSITYTMRTLISFSFFFTFFMIVSKPILVNYELSPVCLGGVLLKSLPPGPQETAPCLQFAAAASQCTPVCRCGNFPTILCRSHRCRQASSIRRHAGQLSKRSGSYRLKMDHENLRIHRKTVYLRGKERWTPRSAATSRGFCRYRRIDRVVLARAPLLADRGAAVRPARDLHHPGCGMQYVLVLVQYYNEWRSIHMYE